MIALAIFYRGFLSKLQLSKGQRFSLQRLPKVKGFNLGLEISAGIFRTNIDKGVATAKLLVRNGFTHHLSSAIVL